MKLQIIYVLVFMFFNPSHPFKLKINNCTTKAKTSGFCREKILCEGAKEPLLPEDCPINQICCPTREVSRKKCWEYAKAVFETEIIYSLIGEEETTNDQCGIVAVPLIVGGEKAAIKEFPHMVAMGLRKTPISEVSWLCGGSLISELYVMTAGHCIKKNIPESELKKYVLKLGAVNFHSNDVKYVQVRGIQNVIVHPRYHKEGRSPRNDIALLRMDKKVKFTPYVRPTCLDFIGDIAQEKVLATGYGTTSYGSRAPSPDLMKVILDIIDRKTCSDHWKHLCKNGLPDSTTCIGSKNEGKDTCLGDSGGPIQVIEEKPYCMYRVLGITSSAMPGCGNKNSYNIYTRVFWFVPWIESIVWPGEN